MSPDTRSLILQEAEFLIRTRGYSAFSYADLSARVAITKASVHYYFPTKEELIVVLVREYIERFVATLARIKQQHAGPGERLRAYETELFTFLDTRRAQLLSGLAEKKQIDDQIKTDLNQALTEFGQTFGAAQKTTA